MKKPIEWTGAHRREALAREHELAAEFARRGTVPGLGVFADVPSEAAFRGDLRRHFTRERIDAEVRRVDALATGRMVRETGWRVERPNSTTFWCSDERNADVGAGMLGRKIRATRIRRAR